MLRLSKNRNSSPDTEDITMDQAGYSSKPLIEKLGFAPGDTVCVHGAPDWYKEYLRGCGITVTDHLPANWLHAFFVEARTLTEFCATLPFTQVGKGIWICWVKGAYGQGTDLKEDSLRDILLPYGWVDIKVASVNESWSGLKFVRRKP
jgi:hypothetical protein